MSAGARDLIAAVRGAGGTLLVADGRLKVATPAPLPADVVVRLREAKGEVVALLADLDHVAARAERDRLGAEAYERWEAARHADAPEDPTPAALSAGEEVALAEVDSILAVVARQRASGKPLPLPDGRRLHRWPAPVSVPATATVAAMAAVAEARAAGAVLVADGPWLMVTEPPARLPAALLGALRAQPGATLAVLLNHSSEGETCR